MIKVLIAEDEKRIREGLVGALPWAELGFEVAGSAANGQAALELAQRLKPELLITDIRMPKMDGLELMRRAKLDLPRLKVLILSGYDEFAYAQQAIKYGASDFLVKPVGEEELAAALARIRDALDAEGDATLPAALRAASLRSADAAGQEGTPGHRLVRQVEAYVAQHYRRDLSVKEVADQVKLSPNYFSHLFAKSRGMSFVDYLNSVRVAKACRLLEESELKVYEIAEEVGYTDYKYFSTVFKKIVGQAPTKYRPEADNAQERSST